MGEAVYYAKIKFEDGKTAEEKLPEVKRFFHEGMDACNFWQDNRGMKDREEFFRQFNEKFPMVGKYVSTQLNKNIDHNNGLAGLLDFGEHDDVDGAMDTEEDKIIYCAMVWHCADWGPILAFVQGEFGAVDYGWISDE